MAGFAGAPAAAFEGSQLDAVGDGHAVAVFGSGACVVFHEQQVAGQERCFKIRVAGRKLDALLICGVLPVAVWHANLFLPFAAWSLEQIADQLLLFEGEFDFVG